MEDEREARDHLVAGTAEFAALQDEGFRRCAAGVGQAHRDGERSGLARLYGTVTPAVRGATVFFQVEQAIRPGLRSEATSRFVTRFVTPIKHGTRKSSRFSMIVKIRRSGRYRALVKVRPGPLVSGTSTNSFYLHAAPKVRK